MQAYDMYVSRRSCGDFNLAIFSLSPSASYSHCLTNLDRRNNVALEFRSNLCMRITDFVNFATCLANWNRETRHIQSFELCPIAN